MAIGCVLTGSVMNTITLDVLAQLVNCTSLYHKLHTVIVVVILNDVGQRSADEFVRAVTTNYLYEISIGFIHLLQQSRSVNAVVYVLTSVSDYVEMAVFTSAKSAQYVKILGRGRKQTSRIPGVTSWIWMLDNAWRLQRSSA